MVTKDIFFFPCNVTKGEGKQKEKHFSNEVWHKFKYKCYFMH